MSSGGAAALFLRAHRSGALKLALMSATNTNSSGFVPTCEDDVDALSDCESRVEELIAGTELELGGLSSGSWARSAITFIKEGKARVSPALHFSSFQRVTPFSSVAAVFAITTPSSVLTLLRPPRLPLHTTE